MLGLDTGCPIKKRCIEVCIDEDTGGLSFEAIRYCTAKEEEVFNYIPKLCGIINKVVK